MKLIIFEMIEYGAPFCVAEWKGDGRSVHMECSGEVKEGRLSGQLWRPVERCSVNL